MATEQTATREENTTAVVEAAFRAELAALLAKWGAVIEVDDHYKGFAECGSDLRATVTIEGRFENNEVVRPFTTFDLSKYITADTVKAVRP